MLTAGSLVPHSFGHGTGEAMTRYPNPWSCHCGPSDAPGRNFPLNTRTNRSERLPPLASFRPALPPPASSVVDRTDLQFTNSSGRTAAYSTRSEQMTPSFTSLRNDRHPSLPALTRGPPPDSRYTPGPSSTAGERSGVDLAGAHRRRPLDVSAHVRHGQFVSGRVASLPRHQQRAPAVVESQPPRFNTLGARSRAQSSGKSKSPPPQFSSSRPNPKSSMALAAVLNDEKTNTSKTPERLSRPPLTRYSLFVRQQPQAARSCGFGERDRRVVDPPPIVQLAIDEPGITTEEMEQRLRSFNMVVHCSIWNEAGDEDNSSMSEDYRQQRRMMGTLVSSPFYGQDEHGKWGCFFCFPDLSARTPGKYRLKFALIVLDPAAMRPGMTSPVVAEAMSDIFTVLNAKDFPGMKASSALTRRLKEQGCLISIKKGNDKNKDRAPSKSKYDEDSEGDDEEEGETSRKKIKRRRYD